VSELKARSVTDKSVFTEEQKKSLDSLRIPRVLNILNAGAFETKKLQTDTDAWRLTAAGTTFTLKFTKDKDLAMLQKFLCYRYSTKNSPSHLNTFLSSLNRQLSIIESITADEFINKLEFLGACHDDANTTDFYVLLFSLKQLIAFEFPGFEADYDFQIDLLPRPKVNRFLIYQEIDNVLALAETTLIQNGLVRAASHPSDFSLNDIRDICLLGLCYSTGARPVQLSKISADHFRVDFGSDSINSGKYSLRLPLAKQGKTLSKGYILVKLSEELALLMSYLIEMNGYLLNEQLFKSANTVLLVNRAINRALKILSPPDTRLLIESGEHMPPALTSSDFRHNLGHTLAMRGASAEEIAYILGHSSTVAARHYILATPELADIKARTLGINPVYQDIIAMMMTGKVTKNERWKSDIVAGSVNCNFHIGIGGCAKDGTPCHLSPVRACYGCQDFHPFADADHMSVLNDVQAELEQLSTLSDATGSPRSPIVAVHEQTKFEVISVIARCKLYQDGEDESCH
jgi:integrase